MLASFDILAKEKESQKVSILKVVPSNSVTQEELQLLLLNQLEANRIMHEEAVRKFKEGNCQNNEMIIADFGGENELLRQKFFEKLQQLHCGNESTENPFNEKR